MPCFRHCAIPPLTAMSAKTITVHVKMLNGDLFEIKTSEKYPSGRFGDVVKQIYDTFPDIPYECLVLAKQFKYEDEEEEFEEIHKIFDDDDDAFLFAFVDTSLVHPVVKHGGDRGVGYSNLPVFTIKFFSKTCSSYEVDLCCSRSENKYALKDTFSYKDTFSKRDYIPTKRTIWFDSPIDCLKSVESARFPRDEETFESILTQFEQFGFNLRQNEEDQRGEEIEMEEEEVMDDDYYHDDHDDDDHYDDDDDDDEYLHRSRWIQENDY